MIVLALNQSGGKAGPIGLFVVLALVAATYFLFRSMSTQLKKVPPSFETDNKQADGKQHDTLQDSKQQDSKQDGGTSLDGTPADGGPTDEEADHRA